jgi:hypothetical protein
MRTPPTRKPAAPPGRGIRAGLVPALLLAVAAVLAVAGGLVLRAEAAGASGAGVVHTGYGDVRVERSEAVRGLDPHDLGGAAHGIAGLVNLDQQLVQITVRVTGTGSGAPVDPNRFRLRAGGGDPIAPATSSLAAGKLPEGANSEGVLGFVAAETATGLRLSVPDGDRAVDLPISADLVDGSPAGDAGDLTIDPFATADPTDSGDHDHGAAGDGATPSGTAAPAAADSGPRPEGTTGPSAGGADDQVRAKRGEQS